MANGLINLQTDLKSLRYGSDKPYVTKNIGQAPGSQIGMEVQARIDDTSRIAQMLIDKPGIKYLLNEALLQQTNIDDKIRNRGNRSVAGVVLGQLGNTLVGTAKILGSTLAQVPVNGTGLHFLKGFRTDTYLKPTNQGPTNAFTRFFGEGGVEGAQYALRGEEVPGKVTTQFIGDKGDVVSPQGADPKFTYNAPIKKDGDQGTNWNEKPNNQIVDKLPPLLNSAIAKNGGVVNVTNTYQGSAQGETIQGPDGELTELPATAVEINTPETTLTKGTIGIPNKNIQGNITPLEQPVIKPFTEGDQKKKAKNSTKDNISNALAGSAIALSGEIETTVTTGVKTKQNLITGSLSNKNVKYDLDDNGVNTGKVYTSTSPYTGKDAAYNIGATLSGSYIIPTGGPVPTDLVVGMSIQDSKNKPQYEKSHTDPTTNRVYTEGNKYYEEQKNRKIGDSQKNVIREKRVGLGDQSKRNKSGVAYWTNPTDDEIDQINYLDVTTVRPEGAGVGRDLAKLYFEIITPDAQPRFLYFRAFIDNFDDGYTADWQAHKYVGRAENFYTYGGFDRDITLSFKVAAATRVEMKPLYKKMVYLASATAPTYGGMMTKYMRGTFAKMTVGSYLDQVPGVITSVKYNLIEGMPWEIAMGQPEGVEPESQVLPMGMQCAVTFRPIHTFAPQTGLYPYFTNASQDPRYFTEDDAVLI